MGVQNPSYFSYKSVPLEWKHFSFILHELSRQKVASSDSREDGQPPPPIRPVIDVDANCIGFRGLVNTDGPLYQVLKLAYHCKDDGVEVNLICDGDSRDSSKRASTSRSAERERMSLKSLQHEIELSTILQNEGNIHV